MGRQITDYIEVVDSSPPQLTLGFPHPRKHEPRGFFFCAAGGVIAAAGKSKTQARASCTSASPVTRHTRQSGSTSAPIDS